MSPDVIAPDWPAPRGVRALQTIRSGGVSLAPYDSLNLGDHVGDDPVAVEANRSRLSAIVPAEPVWLKQVHGVAVADADRAESGCEADASVSRRAGKACVVMTADCLPVLLCDRAGTVVAAAHAGWRGLAAGVIEATVVAMDRPGDELLAWLGPAIGPDAFEVGDEVRAAFVAQDPQAAAAFVPGAPGKWLADIWLLARQRLAALGIREVWGGGQCTVANRERYFSYRRDGVTGRMGTFIWLE